MMRAKERIRKALRTIMDSAEANGCNIWKAYDAATLSNGWHYVPFGSTSEFLGRSVKEALETIDAIAASREENAE